MAQTRSLWFQENWDKVLGVFFVLVVGGLVGYFSGTAALRERIRASEVELELFGEKIAEIQKIQAKKDDLISKALLDIESLQRQNDIGTATSKLIDLRIEVQRERTISELKELLKEQGLSKSSP